MPPAWGFSVACQPLFCHFKGTVSNQKAVYWPLMAELFFVFFFQELFSHVNAPYFQYIYKKKRKTCNFSQMIWSAGRRPGAAHTGELILNRIVISRIGIKLNEKPKDSHTQGSDLSRLICAHVFQKKKKIAWHFSTPAQERSNGKSVIITTRGQWSNALCNPFH